VANTLWAYATMGREPEPGSGLLRELEGRAEVLAGKFNTQNVANTLWAYATMGREPASGLMRELEVRAEVLAGTLNAQDVANILWAYATMGQMPGAGLMRELEGRAEVLAGTFNMQDVANTLWAFATIGRKPGARLMRELEGRAEAVAGSFKANGVANTLWAYATMGQNPGAGVMRELEGRAEALAGTFNAQHLANTLWAYATMGREPGAGLMLKLEGQAEAVAGTFNAQNLANTLWAYATIGREPGAGMMRELEGRAEALAGTLSARDVANTLWAYGVFSILRAPLEGRRWVQTVMERLVPMGNASSFNTAELCQIHQFFVSCSFKPWFQDEVWWNEVMDMESFKEDMESFKETCRLAFEGRSSLTSVSASQQQVSETLRQMGLSVKDEFRCRKTGYSIDMLARQVHDSAPGMGGKSSTGGQVWKVEFDGPSHFLASGAPTGATLMKRRHLERVGHTLVSVPYWEWDRCPHNCQREQYLRDKLADCVQTPGNAVSET
jgi:hypothetical protein